MTAEINKIHLIRLLRFSRLAAMAGGFVMLLLEVRFQHRAALVDDWRPWMPIVFANLMIYLIPTAGIFWNKGGKFVLIGAYCLTMVLGTIGVYFHSDGHLIEHLLELMRVWIIPPNEGAEIAAHYPPIVAPLAFVGLGAIGLLFCIESPSKVSQTRINTESQPEVELAIEAAVESDVESEVEPFISAKS